MSQAVPTVIGLGCRIKGEMRLAGAGVIAGHVEGDIWAAESLEVTGEGVVQGNVRGGVVEIKGTVNGNVFAGKMCRLGVEARVAGELCAGGLEIAEGARFIGHVCIGMNEVAQPAVPAAVVEHQPQAATAERVTPTAAEILPTRIHRFEQLNGTLAEIGADLSRVTGNPIMPAIVSIPASSVMGGGVGVVPGVAQGVVNKSPRIIKARS